MAGVEEAKGPFEDTINIVALGRRQMWLSPGHSKPPPPTQFMQYNMGCRFWGPFSVWAQDNRPLCPSSPDGYGGHTINGRVGSHGAIQGLHTPCGHFHNPSASPSLSLSFSSFSHLLPESIYTFLPSLGTEKVQKIRLKKYDC